MMPNKPTKKAVVMPAIGCHCQDYSSDRLVSGPASELDAFNALPLTCMSFSTSFTTSGSSRSFIRSATSPMSPAFDTGKREDSTTGGHEVTERRRGPALRPDRQASNGCDWDARRYRARDLAVSPRNRTSDSTRNRPRLGKAGNFTIPVQPAISPPGEPTRQQWNHRNHPRVAASLIGTNPDTVVSSPRWHSR